MKVETYHINCGMGKSSDWKDAGFTEEIINNLNEIGYSGTLNNKKIDLNEYLNFLSNEKVNYHLSRIGGNSFEFEDRYLLIVTKSSENEIKCECGGNLHLIDHSPLDTNLEKFDNQIFGEARCDKCDRIKNVIGDIKWKING